MKAVQEREEKGINPVLAVVLAVLFAYFITAAVFIIYAALLTYTGITEKYLQTVITAATGVSAGAGGFFCGRSVRKRGIIWGMLTGLMYGVIMIILGMCLNPDFALGAKTALIAFVSLCGGGLGGVLGVNSR